MKPWFAALLLVALLLKVAADKRAYRRAWQEERLDFERYCDEYAAREQLGYGPPHTLNKALPQSDDTGGSANRQGSDVQDTPG